MKIGVGIVTFNPDIERLRENIDSITKQCSNVLIYDNGSKNYNEIEKIINNYKTVVVQRKTKNEGIASALNGIMTYFSKSNYEWVLTLDQDSVANFNMLKALEKNIHKKNVAIVCPVVEDRNNPTAFELKNEVQSVKKCITSGSLTRIEAWENVGKYDEQMFIDLVDFDFCMRIKMHNLKIIQVKNAVILHQIGNITKHQLFSWHFIVQNHSAFRKYYMGQNMIYFARKYPTLKIKLTEGIRLLKLLITIVLFENNKFKKINALYKGIKNGFKLAVTPMHM